jgi:hypothetical protein
MPLGRFKEIGEVETEWDIHLLVHADDVNLLG